jgi:Family of unknown function (DUF6526)
MAESQSYANHAKNVPLFHYVLLPILMVNFLFSLYRLWQDPNMLSIWAVVMAFAFILTALFARVFALKAQDRLIRLEERMRMRELLPSDLQPRINDFTPDQLVAIRFASDAELPALSAAVLSGNIQKRAEIKKMIKQWRADHCRV